LSKKQNAPIKMNIFNNIPSISNLFQNHIQFL